MEKLISFDLKADFAFFRKPDANNTINLSYNIMHKLSVLGILGAIIGLDGYQKKGELPQYYQCLKHLKVGVEPLAHEKGSYQKTHIRYTNTVGYANKGANLIVDELALIAPAYRIYLLLDLSCEHQAKIWHYLSENKAEFVPYLGKNEYAAWWAKDSVVAYDFELNQGELPKSVDVKTVFLKEISVKNHKAFASADLLAEEQPEQPFVYFERLPKAFDEDLMQYELGEFVYTNYPIKKAHQLSNLYLLKQSHTYVQLI
jgi:CRISPR-associated protein Cas5h